jgi:hypothetical protein
MPAPRPRVFRVKDSMWICQWKGVSPATIHKSWQHAFNAAVYLFQYWWKLQEPECLNRSGVSLSKRRRS